MGLDHKDGGLRPTILVVDDDTAVLRFVAIVLRRHGYQVLEAASGLKAIATAAAHTGALDLVLTDVMMPELDGPALWKALSRERPEAEVLYMSGAWEPNGHCKPGRFLAKPFSITDLLEKVEKLTA